MTKQYIETLLKTLEGNLEIHKKDGKWRKKLDARGLGGIKRNAFSFHEGVLTCLTDIVNQLKRDLQQYE